MCYLEGSNLVFLNLSIFSDITQLLIINLILLYSENIFKLFKTDLDLYYGPENNLSS